MASKNQVAHYFQNQPSFAAGEIAPELYGRIDQELYYIGLRTCYNFIVRQYGGVSNRPGTTFISRAKDSTKNLRLVPFQFNEEQTYVLEFGDETMRVIKDGAEVLVDPVKNITGITQANPGVVTAVAHGFNNGDDVYLADIVGMVELNSRSVRVANKTTDTFELTDYAGNNINTSGYASYSSGGTAGKIYTLTTPWDHLDIFELNYAQSNDVLTVVHNDYYPYDVTRTDHDAWTATEFVNEEGPFKSINTTATTVQASAVSGSGVTITASAALFDATMVDELFYIEQKPSDTTVRWEVGKTISINDIRLAGAHYYKATTSGTSGTYRPDHTEGTSSDGAIIWEYLHSGFGIVKFTAYTDTTHMTATVIKRLPENVTSTATDIWAKAAWSDAQGYPTATAYHKQRLIFGGTTQLPNGCWFSGVGTRTYFGKSNPILDDDGINLQLDTTQVNAIRHLLPLKELVVLTSASEQLINGANDVISAVDLPFAKVQGYTGSSKRIPIIIGNTAIFVQDMGSVIRSLQYSLDTDSFSGIDLSARSPHLFRNKSVTDWAFHRHPLSVVWAVMDDGTLNGFTYMEEQKVYAWHQHETDGFFESVCCIREGDETAAYFVVKREINGETVRYVERMASRYFDTIEDAFFMDAGLKYDGRNVGTTTITISGGTTWDKPETLTLTASASLFKSSDVGDEVHFSYVDANGLTIVVRIEITAFTSGTVVSGIPSKIVPASLRSTATTAWSIARDVFFPLWHLEGCDVAVLADGNVVEGLSVSNGQVTLPDHAAVANIGLPYISQIETLDIAQPQGQLKGKTVNIARVFITVQETRSLFVGTSQRGFDDLFEQKQRDPSIGYDAAIPAETNVIEVQTNNSWSNKGRIYIQQSYPLPVTINCITPEVTVGFS